MSTHSIKARDPGAQHPVLWTPLLWSGRGNIHSAGLLVASEDTSLIPVFFLSLSFRRAWVVFFFLGELVLTCKLGGLGLLI